VLASNPDQAGQPVFGVQVRTWFEVDYPHQISIDTGQVGGPSAGLAFTLGLVDDLTPGDLTGGKSVAATGTIAPDGTVGPIGGLDHKVDAVRHAGVTLFLVPDSQTPAELAKARSRAEGKVDIVPVHTLEDALNAIAAHGGQDPKTITLPQSLKVPNG
jgi:PDZ domain-containing protein